MSVLVKKQEQKKTGYTIGVITGKAGTKGEVGIEIEVEGNVFEKERVPTPWKYVHDGSLRGQDNAEYVLKAPIMFDQVPGALETLWAMFKRKGSVLDESNRTSVHVHLNVQKFHMNRLTSLMAMYFAMEELLTQWCGEHRVGNLFCMRAKDANAIISQLSAFIRNDGQYAIGSNHHYAALNANAISKYGSLEFRTLRGVSDPKVIEDWVGILERLYVLSKDYPDPRSVCDMFSANGPLHFLEDLLGDKVVTIRKGVSWSNEAISDSLYNGIRLAQDLAFCRDWSLFKAVELQPDPFDRDPKKLAQKLGAGGLSPAEAQLQAAMNAFDTVSMNESAASLSTWGQTIHAPPEDMEALEAIMAEENEYLDAFGS